MAYYHTVFSGTEAPISEGGAWRKPSGITTEIDTSGGLAFGTQTGTGGFDDSIAILSSFPSGQVATAVVHRAASFAPSTTREVELVLRATDFGSGVVQWYEFNFAYDGAYAQIIKIGPNTSTFSLLDGVTVPGGILDGFIVMAQAIGGQLKSFLNRNDGNGFVPVASAVDSSYASGNPGMGFWRGGPPTGTDTNVMYSFSSYTAQGLGDSPLFFGAGTVS